MFRQSYKVQERVIVFLFLLVPIGLLLAFTYYPATTLIYNSFTDWDGVSVKRWIGLTNYKQFFSDPSYYGVLFHNMAYFIIGLVQVGVALYFAFILNQKLKFSSTSKVILFMPYMINSVAVASILNYVFDNSVGAINVFLRSVGLDKLAVNWIANPGIVNYTFAFMSSWKYMGLLMVIFIGALNSIPNDIYEAADIDGASKYMTFRHITLPSIWSVIQLNLFLNLSGALATFEMTFSIYPAGSPLEMSETFVSKTIMSAFKYNQYGMASAMGVILVVFTSALVLLQYKIFSKGEK